MSIEVIKKNVQAKGAFDGGRILENKPIGFSQDGGPLSAYSNLFYWANAWSDEGGLIDVHPHRGFEIMSYVISGEIIHYDNSTNEWSGIKSGDIQLIRAGSGITHAEKFTKNSRMFQIWFDPDLEKTWFKPATYDNYRDADFPRIEKEGIQTKIMANGKQGLISMDSINVEIMELCIDKGSNFLKTDRDKIYSLYLLEGDITINHSQASMDDFIIVKEEKKILIQSDYTSKIFMISTPVSLPYRTYADQIS